VFFAASGARPTSRGRGGRPDRIEPALEPDPLHGVTPEALRRVVGPFVWRLRARKDGFALDAYLLPASGS